MVIPILPRLRALAARGRVVIVSNKEREDRETRVATWLACAPESLPVTASPHLSAALVESINRGAVAIVILVEGFVSHKSVAAIVRSAKEKATPLIYIGRGGTGETRAAFEEFERRLGSRAG